MVSEGVISYMLNAYCMITICQAPQLPGCSHLPENDDHPIVNDGQYHDLDPNIIKLFCWINDELFPAEREIVKKLKKIMIQYFHVAILVVLLMR